jgi:protocatechuate 3,4-dioxygenase beta subunit
MITQQHRRAITGSAIAIVCLGMVLLYGAHRGDQPLPDHAVLHLTTPAEPGEPLQVSGTVYAADGRTPMAGAALYIYHTDIHGYYSPGGREESKPRLKGNLTTDSQGRFLIQTIKPGAYPQGNVPAHVHVEISMEGSEKQFFELRFAGDPLISEARVKRAREAGKFASILALEKGSDGVLRCQWSIRLQD